MAQKSQDKVREKVELDQRSKPSRSSKGNPLFPLRVLGTSGTTKTNLGALNGPRVCLTWAIISLGTSAGSVLTRPAEVVVTTNATTAWPVSSSSNPTEAASPQLGLKANLVERVRDKTVC